MITGSVGEASLACLMRTGSHERAEFSGRKDAEYTWFSLSASLPLLSMDAQEAARQIVAGVRHRRAEVILTPAAQVAARSAPIAPGLTASVLHLASTALPGSEANGEASGLSLRPVISSDLFKRLTTLGRRAARRFNELPQEPA